MSKRYLTAELRARLRAADDRRCAYCHTTEANTGQPMTLDHAVPEARGGLTVFDNLCFACRRCNEFKGNAITGRDPLTDEIVPLFHPRRQHWSDHFAWNAPATHLIGLTTIGRATILALNMNNLEFMFTGWLL